MKSPHEKALKGVSRSVAIARNKHEKKGGTFIDSGLHCSTCGKNTHVTAAHKK